MKYDRIHETEDAADQDTDANEGLLHSSSSPRAGVQSHRQLLYLLAAEHVLLVIAFFALWRLHAFSPPPTNLNYQTLTPDNKSYPTGPLSWSHRFDPLPCGKTPEEALARGCHFDLLGTAWLPPRCIDHELVNEFLDIGKWDYYTRLGGTEKEKYSSYEPEVLGSIATPKAIWTSRRWHVVHCLYMFKKLNRAVVNGWPVDGESVSEPHTEHCMGAFKEALFGPPLDPEEIEVFLEIIYPSC